MPRPPRYDESQLLDAAVRLAAAGGPAAVTMAAVAKESGAPNGSVYHRFPQRTVLLAELWLRTVERFQVGYRAALDSAPQPLSAARAAAREAVGWCRANPGEAAVLLHGPEAFGRRDWPEEYVRRADRGNRHALGAVAALAAGLGASHPADIERVTLALIDLPIALVRRHMRDGGTLPAHAEQLAEDCTSSLLADLQPHEGGGSST
ncbi:TetR/AcrR family transcriptional regulator [Kitasatospora camelliae]|uniref:Helix-turn-helix domain-containing protein n=1 Tax=Kitasatospora camelliae TaxID=3156397 RepID=A0AAU8K6M0_9ACTN